MDVVLHQNLKGNSVICHANLAFTPSTMQHCSSNKLQFQIKQFKQLSLSLRRSKQIHFLVLTGSLSNLTSDVPLWHEECCGLSLVVAGLEGCADYLDDAVVFSDTWGDHIQCIGPLFSCLAEVRVTINLAKCEFARAMVMSLSYHPAMVQVCPVDKKVWGGMQYPVPTIKKRLFLGLVGFYLSFCNNFFTVVVPLTESAFTRSKFVWSAKCHSVFDNVKTVLLAAPVLAAPCPDRPFIAGAVLSLVGSDNRAPSGAT